MRYVLACVRCFFVVVVVVLFTSKHRPWIAPPPPTLDATGKEIIEEKPEKSWALLGKYISQYVVFTDAHHAWLLRYVSPN